MVNIMTEGSGKHAQCLQIQAYQESQILFLISSHVTLPSMSSPSICVSEGAVHVCILGLN